MKTFPAGPVRDTKRRRLRHAGLEFPDHAINVSGAPTDVGARADLIRLSKRKVL